MASILAMCTLVVLDVGEVVGDGFVDDPPGADQYDSVGALEDLGLLGAVQHRRPPSTSVAAQLAIDVRLGADVDAARRFLEHDDRRFGEQGGGEGDLLLVAPRQRTDRRFDVGHLDAVAVPGGNRRGTGGAAPPPPERPGVRGTGAQCQVFLDSQIVEQAAGAVAGDVLDVARTGQRPRGVLEAGERAHQLAPAGSLDAHHGENLPGGDPYRDVGEGIAAMGPTSHLEHDFITVDAFLGRASRGHRPGDELAGDALGDQVGAAQLGAGPSIADHDDPCAVGGELVEAVGHEDDDLAGVGEGVHVDKHLGGLLEAERRVGFVEQHDGGVLEQTAHDLDALAKRQRQRTERSVDDFEHAEVADKGALLGVQTGSPDEKPFASRNEVLGHREVGEDLGFLVDDSDLGTLRRDPHVAVDLDPAVV